jgi:hypothetical protein
MSAAFSKRHTSLSSPQRGHRSQTRRTSAIGVTATQQALRGSHALAHPLRADLHRSAETRSGQRCLRVAARHWSLAPGPRQHPGRVVEAISLWRSAGHLPGVQRWVKSAHLIQRVAPIFDWCLVVVQYSRVVGYQYPPPSSSSSSPPSSPPPSSSSSSPGSLQPARRPAVTAIDVARNRLRCICNLR